jgi:hypothetical protein
MKTLSTTPKPWYRWKTEDLSFFNVLFVRGVTLTSLLIEKRQSWALGWSLQPTKTFFVFFCLSYVGFVPVSDLLDMFSLIWQGVFLSKVLFMTDPKPKFGWRVFEGPRSPKTFHVLGDLWQLDPILR